MHNKSILNRSILKCGKLYLYYVECSIYIICWNKFYASARPQLVSYCFLVLLFLLLLCFAVCRWLAFFSLALGNFLLLPPLPASKTMKLPRPWSITNVLRCLRAFHFYLFCALILKFFLVVYFDNYLK